MSVRYEDPWLTVHVGDCREILATLPAESVHCVVTSPPYWGLRDYGVVGQLGLEATPDAYVDAMVAVFREVRRVLRDDGTLWLNLGDSYNSPGANNNGRNSTGLNSNPAADVVMKNVRTQRIPTLKPKDLVGIPWRVAFALQADGWYLRSDIIWAKPNPMPESVTDRPTKAHEYLFLLTKAPRYFYDADAVREAWADERMGASGAKTHPYLEATGKDVRATTLATGPKVPGRNRRTVWTVATQPYPGAHFAVMPEALVEPCVLAGCPDQTCATCGAPWERVVERTTVMTRPGAASKLGVTESERRAQGRDTTVGLRQRPETTTTTTGWKPTCDHDAEPVPATVLDPFAGTGTVGLVAQRLSRRAVLIDLNPDYIAQCLERNQDQPLGLVEAAS